jgi:hypothetical protein
MRHRLVAQALLAPYTAHRAGKITAVYFLTVF